MVFAQITNKTDGRQRNARRIPSRDGRVFFSFLNRYSTANGLFRTHTVTVSSADSGLHGENKRQRLAPSTSTDRLKYARVSCKNQRPQVATARLTLFFRDGDEEGASKRRALGRKPENLFRTFSIYYGFSIFTRECFCIVLISLGILSEVVRVFIYLFFVFSRRPGLRARAKLGRPEKTRTGGA